MKVNEEKESRTAIKHSAILSAAKIIFLKQGYSVASMDDIAKQAIVSKRTIYDHFGTKKKLFESMLHSHWQAVQEYNPSLVLNTKMSCKDHLKHFANVFLKFLYQPDTIALFRLLIAEADRFPDLAAPMLIDEKAPFTRALVEFLNAKKISGELILENTERSAAYLMGMLKEQHFWPMMLGFTQQKKLVAPSKLIEDVVSVFLKIYHTDYA